MRSWIIWSKTFNCYSEFHASSETIIRQLPEKTVTIRDISKIQNNTYEVWCVARQAGSYR